MTNNHSKWQLRIGYVLVTLAFIGPFLIILAGEKLFGINLPWWGMTVLGVFGVLLMFWVLDKFSPRQQPNSRPWQPMLTRDTVLYAVAYMSGSGIIISVVVGTTKDSALSVPLIVLGVVLVIIGLYFSDRRQRKARR